MNMMCFLLSITNRMKQLWPNCIKFLAAVNELLINKGDWHLIFKFLCKFSKGF